MTVMEYEEPLRRAQAPKRQPTPGARKVELMRVVDYGDGEEEERYADQWVIDCYAPGSAVPVTVTEKAFHYCYRLKGYTLEPGGQADGVPSVQIPGVDAAVTEAAEELAEATAARERAEQESRAAQREAERLRAEVEQLRAQRSDEQSAKAGGKANR